MLANLGLDHVELDQRGRVVDGPVNVLQRGLEVLQEVEVLRQKVVGPQQTRRRLLLDCRVLRVLRRVVPVTYESNQ